MSVEKSTSMPTKPNVSSKPLSLHRPSSSQQVWTCMKSDGKFMNALTSFMNESWVTVSEIREKSGLNPNYEISDEELSRRIEEISRRLQMKYKEVSNLESQKAQLLSRSGVGATSVGYHSTSALQGPEAPILPNLPPVASLTRVQHSGSQILDHFQRSEQYPGSPLPEHFQPVGCLPSAQHPGSPLPEPFQPVASPPTVLHPESTLPRNNQRMCPAILAQDAEKFQPVTPSPQFRKKTFPVAYQRISSAFPIQYPGSPLPEHFQPRASPTPARQYGYSSNVDNSYFAGSGGELYWPSQNSTGGSSARRRLQFTQSQSGSRGYGYPPSCTGSSKYNSSGGYQNLSSDLDYGF